MSHSYLTRNYGARFAYFMTNLSLVALNIHISTYHYKKNSIFQCIIINAIKNARFDDIIYYTVSFNLINR